MPRSASSPRTCGRSCRISSSERNRPDWFRLDQRVRWVRRERYCTVVNCNPNCNPHRLSAWQVGGSAHSALASRTRSVPAPTPVRTRGFPLDQARRGYVHGSGGGGRIFHAYAPTDFAVALNTLSKSARMSPVQARRVSKYSEIVWLPMSRIASTSTNADRLTGLPNTYGGSAASVAGLEWCAPNVSGRSRMRLAMRLGPASSVGSRRGRQR